MLTSLTRFLSPTLPHDPRRHLEPHARQQPSGKAEEQGLDHWRCASPPLSTSTSLSTPDDDHGSRQAKRLKSSHSSWTFLSSSSSSPPPPSCTSSSSSAIARTPHDPAQTRAHPDDEVGVLRRRERDPAGESTDRVPPKLPVELWLEVIRCLSSPRASSSSSCSPAEDPNAREEDDGRCDDDGEDLGGRTARDQHSSSSPLLALRSVSKLFFALVTPLAMREVRVKRSIAGREGGWECVLPPRSDVWLHVRHLHLASLYTSDLPGCDQLARLVSSFSNLATLFLDRPPCSGCTLEAAFNTDPSTTAILLPSLRRLRLGFSGSLVFHVASRFAACQALRQVIIALNPGGFVRAQRETSITVPLLQVDTLFLAPETAARSPSSSMPLLRDLLPYLQTRLPNLKKIVGYRKASTVLAQPGDLKYLRQVSLPKLEIIELCYADKDLEERFDRRAAEEALRWPVASTEARDDAEGNAAVDVSQIQETMDPLVQALAEACPCLREVRHTYDDVWDWTERRRQRKRVIAVVLAKTSAGTVAWQPRFEADPGGLTRS